MAEYVILTDATADLTAELEAETGVVVIPMTVDMNGKVYSFAPSGGEISTAEFYRRQMAGEDAHTSQINIAVYQQYFEAEMKAGRDVLYIGFSSALSSSFSAAVNCAERLREAYPERKLFCVDSLCASAGEGLLVYAAAQKKKAGMDIDTLAAWTEREKARSCQWFTVEELSYLHKGGRVSTTVAVVGTMLNIKPILHVSDEGKLVNVSKARGRKKSLDTLAEIVARDRRDEPEGPVFVGCGTKDEDVAYLRERIMALAGAKNVWFVPVGPVIGAHTGPTVITAFFFGDKR
ncbi:MAG: DegV family protein [Peptococcaceae bacterium]|jgi:DegV family protein with EDD domain|nr:DegV family protein [Peptococcaceae bacterium]